MEFGNTMFSSLQILTAIILIVCLFYNVALTVAGDDFVSVQRRPGERDIMIRLAGVSAMETATGVGPSSEIDYVYREVTDGSYLIQAVYDDEYQLKNCQITDDEEKITLLLTKQHELSVAQMRPKHGKLNSAQITKASTQSAFNLPELSAAIGIVPPVLTKSDLELESVYDKFQYDNATIDNLYFKYNGLVEDLPFPANTMLNMEKMKEECELYSQRVRDTFYQQYPEKIVSRYQRSTGTLSREKRGLLTWPGTLWCGKGTQAQSFSQLGENTFTDRCCRAHDHCPLEWTIPGRVEEYHLFNRNFFTISHCKCDKMFHRCLRQAKTTVAKEVGTTYFNRFSIQCFVFKEKEQCVDKSWWGTCNKYEKVATALIRDGHTFPKSAKRQARDAVLNEERALQAEQKAEERARKHAEAAERRNNKTMAAEARQIQKEESAGRKEAKQVAAEERKVMKEESALRKVNKQAETEERRQNKTIAAETRILQKEEAAAQRKVDKQVAAEKRRIWVETAPLRKQIKQAEAAERRQNKTIAANARVLRKEEIALRKEMKQIEAEERKKRKPLDVDEAVERKEEAVERKEEAVEITEKESSERYIVTEMDTGEMESEEGYVVTEKYDAEWLGQVEISRVNK